MMMVATTHKSLPQITSFRLDKKAPTVHFDTFSDFYPLKPLSHCPEIDTRWTHEYGIVNFAGRWPRATHKGNIYITFKTYNCNKSNTNNYVKVL